MGCHHGNHADQSGFEVRKTCNLDLKESQAKDGQVRGILMVFHQSDHTDQSDCEVMEAPAFNRGGTQNSESKMIRG